MIPRPVLAAFVSLAAVSAQAAETGGCGRFAWDLGAEADLLRAAGPAAPGTKAAMPPLAERLTLRPADLAGVTPPPGAKPRPGFAGAMHVAITEAGLYRVTLSGEAWIDAVQNEAAPTAEAFSGIADCPGMRKSVKFRFAPGDVVLQIRGSASDAISLAVTRDR